MKISLFEHIIQNLLLYILTRLNRKNRTDWPAMAVFAHDFIGTHINVLGRYERWELEAIRPFIAQLANSGIALDVGANIGNHSLFFQEYFDHVCSFEPNPRTAKLLELNTNTYERIQLRRYGLSDQDATLTAMVPCGNAGGARISDTQKRDSQEVQFEVRRFDDTPDAGLPVSLVKMDVEGHEVPAINGMRGMLQRQWPALLFECHLSAGSQDAQATIQTLRGVGYDTFYAVMQDSAVPYRFPTVLRRFFRLMEFIVRSTSREYSLVLLDEKLARDYSLVVATKSETSAEIALRQCINLNSG